MIEPLSVNNIYHTEDSWKTLRFMKKGSVNAVITDPDYQDKNFDLDWLKWVCTGNIVVFCKPENQFFQADNYMFWLKPQSTKNFGSAPGRYVEMILVLRQGDTFNKLHWPQMSGVYHDILDNPPLHPFEKPRVLAERMVRMFTRTGDLVLDLFSGSATFSLAAQQLQRRYIAFDCEQKWVDLGRVRLAGASYERLLELSR